MTVTMSPGRPMTRLMNGVGSGVQAGGRVEHDDVAAAVRIPARGELVHQHVLPGLEGPFHRVLLHLVRLGNEVLDDEEDDEREDQGLGDFDETSEAGTSVHERGV